MKSSNTLSGRICGAVLLVLTGAFASACAQPPRASLQQTEQMIQEARHADAEEYTPQALNGAEEALASAREQIAKRDYAAAREWLKQAAENARAARDGVPAAREALRTDAKQTFEIADKDLEHADALLVRLESCAQTCEEDPAIAPDILKARLEQVRSDVSVARKDLARGTVRDAHRRAEDAVDDLDQMVGNIESAMKRAGRPPTARS